jgi:hypothetical protein
MCKYAPCRPWRHTICSRMSDLSGARELTGLNWLWQVFKRYRACTFYLYAPCRLRMHTHSRRVDCWYSYGVVFCEITSAYFVVHFRKLQLYLHILSFFMRWRFCYFFELASSMKAFSSILIKKSSNKAIASYFLAWVSQQNSSKIFYKYWHTHIFCFYTYPTWKILNYKAWENSIFLPSRQL